MNVQEQLQDAIKKAHEANEAVKALEAKIKQQEEEKQTALWEPKIGEIIYYPSCDNLGHSVVYGNCNFGMHKRLFELGMAFRTEKECEEYIKKTLAKNRIIRRIKELELNFELNHVINQKYNYELLYNVNEKEYKVDIFSVYVKLNSALTSKNDKVLIQIINEMKSDLDIVFGVE